MKPYELHQSCRTNDLFSFSISYREVHAIFKFLHYLDGWQWDCQWIIMNLQGVCNGAFPTSVFHGKLGTSSQSWWAPILLPTQIPTGLKFMIQEFSWVCSQNKRIWVGVASVYKARLRPNPKEYISYFQVWNHYFFCDLLLTSLTI